MVNDRLSRITGELDRRGFRRHEHNAATAQLVVLGVMIDGKNWRISHQPKRAWRMYLGLKFINWLHVLRGWQMKRIVGHLVSYLGVIRPALACSRACYDFHVKDLEAPRKIPDAVRSELAVARGLVFLAVADLAPNIAPFALISDSSAKGYAVHTTSITADEIKPLIAAPERSRFTTREDAPPPDDELFAGAMLGPRFPMDEFLDEILRRPRRRGPRRPRVLIRTGFNLVPLPDDFVPAGR